MGGIVINGQENIKGDIQEVMKMLREERIHSAEITVKEPVTLEEFADAIDESLVWRRAIIIANKGDAPGSKENYEKLVKAYGDRFKIVPVSAKRKINLDKLKDELYDLAGIIRVFTKSPGEEPAYRPQEGFNRHGFGREDSQGLRQELPLCKGLGQEREVPRPEGRCRPRARGRGHSGNPRPLIVERFFTFSSQLNVYKHRCIRSNAV